MNQPSRLPILENPVDRTVAERDVPLVAVPARRVGWRGRARGRDASIGLVTIRHLTHLPYLPHLPHLPHPSTTPPTSATDPRTRVTVPPANPRRSVVTRTGRPSAIATRAGTGWRQRRSADING